MKKTKFVLPVLLLVMSFVVGALVYSKMPEQVVTHWGTNGEANGFMGRFWGVFFVPVLMTLLYFFLYFVPKIDPRHQNIEQFRDSYNRFLNILILFLFTIHLYSIAWNLGQRFDIGYILSIALAGLFYSIGMMVEEVKPNWFIGIRTPWTLSNDTVWQKTHKVGSRLYKAAAIFCLLGLFFPHFVFVLTIFPIIAVSLYLVAFSYFEFKKLKKY